MGYININSAVDKILSLQLIDYSENYDLLFIAETWFEGVGKKIEGFTMMDLMNRTDTYCGNHGGVACYMRSSLALNARKYPLSLPNSDFNLQGTAIEINNTVLAVVYRPFGQSLDDYLNVPKFITNNFKLDKKDCIVLGDFNLPGIDWETAKSSSTSVMKRECEEEVAQAIMEAGMIQIVRTPTHCRGNILDLVCTTDRALIDNLEVIKTEEYIGHPISDHFMINFDVNLATSNEVKTMRILNHKKADFHGYRIIFKKIGGGQMWMVSNGTLE